MDSALRRCSDDDVPAILEIINDAAAIYRGAIPDDCWHEPYMTRSELLSEIAAGVEFWGAQESGKLVGVMGVQKVRDVTLIRHAYVRPSHQGRGAGGMLLTTLIDTANTPILIGTWTAAQWAIRFYRKHGFEIAAPEDRVRLLDTYWKISPRQRDVSVVLGRPEYFAVMKIS